MNKTVMQNDLLPEYDLKKLHVRKAGSERKSFGGKHVIQLGHDVEVNSDAATVSRTLRFLISIT